MTLPPWRRSGVAGRLAAGEAAIAIGALGLLLGALAQALGVQGLEVDRLHQERRDAAGLDQVADGLPHVRIQDVRAVGAEDRFERCVVETGQADPARLPPFVPVPGLFPTRKS